MHPQLKWQKSLLALALLGATSAALQGATILYEPFDHYGDHVENFINGTHISEHTGSLKMLTLNPEKPNAQALKKPIAIPADLQTGNFKYSFLVNFRDDKRQFSANLNFLEKSPDGKGKGKTTSLTAVIDWAQGSRFTGYNCKSAHPNVSTLRKYKHNYLPNRRWAKVEVRVFKGAVTLWVERDGKMQFEASTRIPENAVLTGLNFSSAGSIQLDDLKVETYQPAGAVIPADGITLEVPAEGLRFSMRTMVPNTQVTMAMNTGSEKPAVYTFQSAQQQYQTQELQNVSKLVEGKLVTERKPVNITKYLYDNLLTVSGPGAKDKLYTRPYLQWRYEDHQIASLLGDWDRQGTDVADHTFEFQIIGNQLWIDDNFYCNIPGDGPVRSVKIGSGYPWSEFKVLPLKKLENGLTLDVPLPTAFNGYFPTALCQENKGTYMLECDGYLSRSPFDGARDCYLRSIPKAQYNRAIVTYSMDGDPEKSTDLTLRLTQFNRNGGRSPAAMAQATMTLPRIKEGEIRTVEMDLPIGDIQDIVFMEKHRDAMDVEVLGGLYEKNQYYMGRYNKPAIRRSSVRVHGVKLIKSPATLIIRNGILGNLFYIYEDVHVTAEMAAVRPGNYTLVWLVKDSDGNVVEQATDEVRFSAAGEKKEIKHAFRKRDVGYYEYTATLKEGSRDLVTFNGSYVCIPPDTRKAGYESPYYGWNFDGSHGAFKGKEQWGELFKRFGIRRTMLRGKYTEEGLKEYKLLQGQFPHNPRGTDADIAKRIRKLVADSPHATQAIIFHESGNGPFPLELIGGKTEITPEQEKRDKAKFDQAMRLARLWRENAPHIKLVIGNSGESVGLIAQLFRQKFPRELIDAMGEESVGMTMPPEASTAMAYWKLRELARIYGYKDLMPEACYEWKSRTGRYATPGTDFSSRDRLIALAWGNKLVPIGMGVEYDNSYYNTIWCGGSFSRNPLTQPRPGALVNCIFTQVFDQVQFLRMIPTGSLTAYALEFKRAADGRFIYALWTARGNVKGAITFPAGTKATHITTLGKEKVCSGTEVLGPVPFYIVADKKMESVQVEMQRTFANEPGDPARATVAAPMDNADIWTLVTGEDKRLLPAGDSKFLRRPGKFTVSTVKDDLKGDCIEVKLVPEGDCPALISEYGFLRMKTPVEIAGTPDTVGVWVKGNSSWGKIFLELEDADGDVWLSAGSGGYGCNTYDWPGLMDLNYDGWHFLQMPLTAKSPVKNHSPGDNHWQWQRERTGDGKLTYPVKVRGVGFMLNRKSLNILEMEDVKDLSIRLKDFSAY